jgi:hypothetical protein
MLLMEKSNLNAEKNLKHYRTYDAAKKVWPCAMVKSMPYLSQHFATLAASLLA